MMMVMALAFGIVALVVVVMMVVLMLVLVMMMVMALAFGIIALVVVVMMVVVMLVLVMMMVMALAFGIVTLVVVVMMVVLMLALVMMMVMALAFGIIALVIVVMMVSRLGGETLKFCFKCISALHSLQKLLTVKLLPWGGNDNRGLVMLAEKLNSSSNLGIAHSAGVTENDSACVVYLIKEEFTEILDVHFAFVGIANGGKAIEDNALYLQSLYRADNI